jgi:hypothetical protein
MAWWPQQQQRWVAKNQSPGKDDKKATRAAAKSKSKSKPARAPDGDIATGAAQRDEAADAARRAEVLEAARARLAAAEKVVAESWFGSGSEEVAAAKAALAELEKAESDRSKTFSRDQMLQFFRVTIDGDAGPVTHDGDVNWPLRAVTVEKEPEETVRPPPKQPESPNNRQTKKKPPQKADAGVAFLMMSLCPGWGTLTKQLRLKPSSSLTGRALLAIIHEVAPGGVDFLYLPPSADKTGNSGYALLNFRYAYAVSLLHAAVTKDGIGELIGIDMGYLEKVLTEFRSAHPEGAGADPDQDPVLVDTKDVPRAIPTGTSMSAAAVPFVSQAIKVDANRASLMTQVEFYFSLDNLLKDEYLRSNMSKDGWVPIELIAGFPMVRKFMPSVADLATLMSTSKVVAVDAKWQRLRAKDSNLRASIALPKPQKITSDESAAAQ